MDNKLTKQEEYEIRWVDAYFNHNFNGGLTSKSLKPHLSMESAMVEASKLLRKAKVQELIELKREHIRMRENVDLGFLISSLTKVVLDCEAEDTERDPATGKIWSKPDRVNLIKAVDGLAKLAGYYTQKIDVSGINEQPQEITINIIKPKK